MRYDRILRRVWVKIGESEYPLSFSLSILERLDSLTNGNLLDILRTPDKLMPVAVLRAGFVQGLKQADHSINESAAGKLCNDYITENGIFDLENVFMACIAVSGLLGTKVSNETLSALDAENKSKEKDVHNGKNASALKE